MSCELWRGKLDQYADAELAGNEAVEMEAHLRQCQACASEALGRIRLQAMTRSAGHRYTAAPEFKLKIARQVARQSRRRLWGLLPAVPEAGARETRRWRWQWQFGLLAAMVALTVGIAVLWSSLAQRQRELGELADLHVATLASSNPVDVVSTDRHTVKPWFAGKLPFTFNLPEFQNTPFELVGGRVAYFEQTAGAQLLLRVRKHQMSVFIFPERALADRLLSPQPVEHKLDFTIQSWSQNGLRYFVISDASPADVAALSELLKRA
jgi:anti-sigma factor RsiW